MMDAVTGNQEFSEHEVPVETPQEAINRLAKLSPIDYDRTRAVEAKALKISVTTLDKEVAKVRSASAEADAGSRVFFKQQTTWPESVDLAAVLDDLAEALDDFVILTPAERDAVALWIAHTWGYDFFQHTPRLAITSPVKRCGKSTLLSVLRATCARALKADNITSAAIFRTIECYAPLTLLIDEADTHLQHNEEIRGVLNSGYEASGAVIRIVDAGGTLEPASFKTFAPVAIAAIKKIPGTIEDRSVPVRLQRKTNDQIVQKLRRDALKRLDEIASKLARWFADHAADLNDNPDVPSALNDREADISVPLLSIALAAGPEWSARGRRALLDVFGQRGGDDDGEDASIMLLSDIRDIFNMQENIQSGMLMSEYLVEKLLEMQDRPWSEWRGGKPMTMNKLAGLLRPYRIKPSNHRFMGAGPRKGYRYAQFKDAWARYLDKPPGDVAD
jgi:putative DNA primase/helicase